MPDHTARNRLNKLLRSIKNAMITPTTSLGFLPRSDGSASFSQGRTSVIASVNGPMEVRIRDELPQEAYVEVIVRPAIGVTSMPLLSSLAIFPPALDADFSSSGTREKYLESRLLSALKPIILRSNHPRTLIQIVVQVVQSAGVEDNAVATLLLLAPALNAAVLALLDAGVPLKSVLAATTVAFLKGSGELIVEPGLEDLKNATSKHVLAFTSTGQLGFVESEGEFEYEDFERAAEAGRNVCSAKGEGNDDDTKMDTGGQGVGELIRQVVREKVQKDLRWRA